MTKAQRRVTYIRNEKKKEEIEEINETEEIQEEEIPPLDEGDYQDVDYKSMLEDTLKDL